MWNISDQWWEHNQTGFDLNLSDSLLIPRNYSEPITFQINSTRNIFVILVYIALFIIAAVGNLTVFISLFRSRHRKSRISLMIRHLTIADLIVTFVMIPIEVISATSKELEKENYNQGINFSDSAILLETNQDPCAFIQTGSFTNSDQGTGDKVVSTSDIQINVGWRLTGRWLAGNEACKIFQFLRALGPYLSSNVLVCVSLDRYFAVIYPFRINAARQRGKIMLIVAWGASLIYCVPQCFVFHLRAHPQNPNFKQCVTFGSFSSEVMELIYNLSCILFLYFIPLAVIIVVYSCIMIEISKTSKATNEEATKNSDGKLRLRRSDTKNIERTRSRTLRLTVTIVVIYICCCTPYAIMTLWYMFDRHSAEKSLPAFLQDFFFMMVVSNSCMNPIVYGSFVIDFKKLSCQCTDCGEKTSTDSMIPHQKLQRTRKTDQHHFARRFIKHFFGQKVNANMTKTSPMNPIQQQKSLRRFGKNIQEYPHRSVTYRFRQDKFYSEVLDSSTTSRDEVVFHSEPVVQGVPRLSEDKNENVLPPRRKITELDFVQAKPNKLCVYYVKNERTLFLGKL